MRLGPPRFAIALAVLTLALPALSDENGPTPNLTTVTNPPQPVLSDGLAVSKPAPNSALHLDGHLGLGAPIGNLGLAVDAQPIRFFSLCLGAGISLDGPQFTVAPRLRLPLDAPGYALDFGVSYSVGAYKWNDDSQGVLKLGESNPNAVYLNWDCARWASLELSLEVVPSTTRFRLYVGYTMLLNTTASSCANSFGAPSKSCNSAPANGFDMAYAGAAMSFFGI
jgi:hypothetical protein